MSGRHGVPLRGLMATKASPLFQGFFGRMFRYLHPAKFGHTDADNVANLTALGAAMSAGFDKPFDGPDPEESGTPALYTYFGQFVDHDITFDPSSSLQKQNDPDALIDFRTPAFDLDNIYGRGPGDQPYLYDGGNAFLLGDPLGGGDPGARDLPRNGAPAGRRRALVGDPRNDENAIVSQLQGLFLRFHNRTAAENPGLEFADLQRLVRFHYQYVVLNDFLPRIVHSTVLAGLKTGGHYDRAKLRFYRPRNAPFMPVEFSAAAYRLGHSMVRPGYRLNDAVLLPIFPVPKQGLPDGLTGFREMNPAWGIDWGRLIDTDLRDYDPPGDKSRRLQFAYRIDTSAVNPLADLPPSVGGPPSSLPVLNLLRGWRLGLPSGQSVARAMGVRPLRDDEILLGKFTDPPAAPEPPEVLTPIASVAGGAFAGNCPLWTYALAETRANPELVKLPVTGDVSVTTPRLGPVGGRIVAEVFLGIAFGDSRSLLNQDPHWHPASGPGYALKDFVRYALGR